MPGRGKLALLLVLTACSCNQPHANPPSPQSSAARGSTGSSPEVVLLAAEGHARVAIVAPGRLLELAANPDAKPRRLKPEERAALEESRRLLAAVQDLAKYLSRMAGSEVAVVQGPPPAGSLPIFIGELGAERFGPVGGEARGRQSFRYVVGRAAIGLYGESDLATGYAIYELLDRLGCRWFMPGELGEEIPRPQRLALPAADEKLAPSTLYRGLWYADEDYKRRNRLGGARIAAGHMLERWITPQQRDEHPDWRAEIKGVGHATRLRWSKPEVADAIAQSIETQLKKRPTDSISISPLDGSDFDESVDKAIDAGDWDPSMSQVSLTDCLLVLANRVAAQVAPNHPDLTFGLLAYTSYTRPPVREKVHPSIVPVIAPITYCRSHAWSDDACPGAKEARQIVEGWAAHAARLAYRGYAYNLAEPAAPNPMLRKWSWEVPFLLAHKVQFFQPETIPNFETSLPALWLGVRLAWDSRRSPDQVLGELFERFYGHAALATRRYVDLIDRAWVETPVYSGGGLGYAARFPPELLAKAREAMNTAKSACQTQAERQRVALLDESLAQLELYMTLQGNLHRGQLGALDEGLNRYLTRASELGDRYAPNSAFGKTSWAKDSMYRGYVERFLQPIYREADRIAREQVLLGTRPTCAARYHLLPALVLPASELPAGDEQDSSYDFCRDTWSSLGKHDYFGAMAYRFVLASPALPAGKASYLWLSKVDGATQVWVNGKLVRPRGVGPDAPAMVEAHLKAMTFDITPALLPGTENQITVVVQRKGLAELGSGGLLGPIYAYRDR